MQSTTERADQPASEAPRERQQYFSVPRPTALRVPPRAARVPLQPLQFKSDYVRADLKRIGVTAAAMLAILAVLTIFFR